MRSRKIEGEYEAHILIVVANPDLFVDRFVYMAGDLWNHSRSSFVSAFEHLDKHTNSFLES